MNPEDSAFDLGVILFRSSVSAMFKKLKDPNSVNHEHACPESCSSNETDSNYSEEEMISKFNPRPKIIKSTK